MMLFGCQQHDGQHHDPLLHNVAIKRVLSAFCSYTRSITLRNISSLATRGQKTRTPTRETARRRNPTRPRPTTPVVTAEDEIRMFSESPRGCDRFSTEIRNYSRRASHVKVR
ncbi:hypothetical protein SeMB42_g00794 [Synchytrium endobioticum]|uniref:Uncharacterized protein n=1 Tax=Synchytrium endobioticum TaxID=286115 RepID=A0A507DPV2_9FUNG|nr:hypothetical protein SeMB42_g00794 [Synchytrium endobioticum]